MQNAAADLSAQIQTSSDEHNGDNNSSSSSSGGSNGVKEPEQPDSAAADVKDVVEQPVTAKEPDQDVDKEHKAPLSPKASVPTASLSDFQSDSQHKSAFMAPISSKADDFHKFDEVPGSGRDFGYRNGGGDYPQQQQQQEVPNHAPPFPEEVNNVNYGQPPPHPHMFQAGNSGNFGNVGMSRRPVAGNNMFGNGGMVGRQGPFPPGAGAGVSNFPHNQQQQSGQFVMANRGGGWGGSPNPATAAASGWPMQHHHFGGGMAQAMNQAHNRLMGTSRGGMQNMGSSGQRNKIFGAAGGGGGSFNYMQQSNNRMIRKQMQPGFLSKAGNQYEQHDEVRINRVS